MGFVESCWIRCRLQIVAVSCFDGVGSGQKQSFVSNANLDHNSLVMPANVQVGFHAKLACIKSHIKVLSCAGHPSIVESQQLLARFRCMAFRQSSWAYQDGEECPLLAVCVGQHWVAKAFFKGVFLLFANCHFFLLSPKHFVPTSDVPTWTWGCMRGTPSPQNPLANGPWTAIQ